MIRTSKLLVVLTLFLAAGLYSTYAQNGATEVQNYFQGKQVHLKIDMPGTQQGVDLRFDRGTPMDWKQYSSRLKKFGVAIPKDERASVTTIVVKKDMIEFQLDGGGFGTFGDDSNTMVEARPVEKSNYEKQLERDIANTDDPDRKRDLQRSLDRERDRRERQDAANRRAAQVASQIKSQQVAQDRMRGGSRFNLRWTGSIPAGQLTPEAVMKLLAPYMDFADSQGAEPASPPGNAVGVVAAAPAHADSPGLATARLKRGMQLSDVTALLGHGRQLSESVSPEGLKTQVFEYLPGDRRVEVTPPLQIDLGARNGAKNDYGRWPGPLPVAALLAVAQLAVGPLASAVGAGLPQVGVLLTLRTTIVATVAAMAAPTPTAMPPAAPIPPAAPAPAPLGAVVFTASVTLTGEAGAGWVGAELL
jgi:hypothetical protein